MAGQLRSNLSKLSAENRRKRSFGNNPAVGLPTRIENLTAKDLKEAFLQLSGAERQEWKKIYFISMCRGGTTYEMLDDEVRAEVDAYEAEREAFDAYLEKSYFRYVKGLVEEDEKAAAADGGVVGSVEEAIKIMQRKKEVWRMKRQMEHLFRIEQGRPCGCILTNYIPSSSSSSAKKRRKKKCRADYVLDDDQVKARNAAFAAAAANIAGEEEEEEDGEEKEKEEKEVKGEEKDHGESFEQSQSLL